MKTIAGGHKLRYLGIDLNNFWFQLAAGTNNILRISNLAH